jgi:acetyltransferase
MEDYKNHRLNAMFEANSIALVGASARPNSFGLRLVESVRVLGFDGLVSYVNPSYDKIFDTPCFPSIKEIDNPPDLALLGVGPRHLEQALMEAIEAGVKSAVIYDSCYGVASDGKTALLSRLRALARESGIAVCGGNGMGFLNVPGKRMGCYYSIPALKPGGISLIAQSGSVFSVLAFNDLRYRFDIVVSPGQEISIGIEEYIEYALMRPTTKVIALFMEGCHNPQRLMQVLAQAQQQGIPIVVCKVGKTEESKKMAQSHTGALAGSEVAYQAIFDYYGVISVDSVDQLMNVALLCSQGRDFPEGGVAMLTDSGGLRELIIDRAEVLDVPLAKMTAKLSQQIKAVLPPSLMPSNPLDCLDSLDAEYHMIYENAYRRFSDSDEVAMLGLEADLRDDYSYVPELFELSCRLSKISSKPCFFYSSFSQANNKKLAQELAQVNVPVINGTEDMLHTVKYVLNWRDSKKAFAQYQQECYYCPEAQVVQKWQQKLSQSSTINEASSLQMLSDFAIPTIEHSICENWQEVQKSAAQLSYPLVLKTAMPEINHKSDLGGVILNIQNENELEAAYQNLQKNLGNRVILQPMLGVQKNSVELAFGCVMDKDFGAIVMLAAGGILIEALQDRQFALAPFGIAKANQMIEKLTINKLLSGYRGKLAIDKQALSNALSNFSVMCDSLKNHCEEIDANPIIASETGVRAIDALVILS